jgi:hypothetical protein
MNTGLLTGWLLFFIAFPSHAQHSVGVGVGLNLNRDVIYDDNFSVNLSPSLIYRYNLRNRWMIVNQLSYRSYHFYHEQQGVSSSKRIFEFGGKNLLHSISFGRNLIRDSKFSCSPLFGLYLVWYNHEYYRRNDFQPIDQPNVYTKISESKGFFSGIFGQVACSVGYAVTNNISIDLIPECIFASYNIQKNTIGFGALFSTYLYASYSF